MNGILALVPVAGALAVTLGIFLFAVRIAKRTLPGMRGGASPQLEVLGRVHLAPRQGVATVRAGDRTLLVSFGEGGVRLVSELPTPVATDRDATSGDAGLYEDDGQDVAGAMTARRPLPWTRHPALPGHPTPPFAAALAAAVGRGGRRLFRTLVLAAILVGASGEMYPALAQAAPQAAAVAQTPGIPPVFDLNLGAPGDDGLQVRGPVGTVLFLGAMTLLPTLLLLMTSFTRILIVLHLLKQALGTQTAPPAHLLSAMALLLTAFIMGPTLQEANEGALVPWLDGEIDEATMMRQASVPFREFMLTQVREEDLATFAEMRPEPLPASVDELPLVVVTSAFVTSELRSAFQMGFALFLPFVVIDLVVASVLMSMGMFMLPPVMISLPFKLLLFVMVDGWSILVGSLVRSFG